VLLAAAPELAALLAADREGRYRRHWVAPSLPIIWLATITGLARLSNPTFRLVAGGLLVAGSITAYVIDGSLPGGGDYEPYDTAWTPRAEQHQRALAEIPADVSVAASRRGLAYLANRREVYVFPPNYAGNLWPVSPLPQYWLFDLTNDQTHAQLSGRASPFRTQTNGTIWTKGPDVAMVTPGAPQLSNSADVMSDWIRIRGWDLKRTGEGSELVVLWESLRRPARPQVRSIRIVDAAETEIQRVDANPLDQLFPTTEWPRGQLWVDRLLLDEVRNDQRIQIGWAERGRRPSEWQDVGKESD
jgi:uncharacterized protein YjeT (DUF2065 family)